MYEEDRLVCIHSVEVINSEESEIKWVKGQKGAKPKPNQEEEVNSYRQTDTIDKIEILFPKRKRNNTL
jgi:hypothetical protein